MLRAQAVDTYTGNLQRTMWQYSNAPNCLLFVQAFDDCTTVASIFKLLDSFEGLLDRGVIAADLERKHLDLVRGYAQDLKEVADMFRETRDNPPLNKNAAPHSGRVTWVRGLKERVGGESWLLVLTEIGDGISAHLLVAELPDNSCPACIMLLHCMPDPPVSALSFCAYSSATCVCFWTVDTLGVWCRSYGETPKPPQAGLRQRGGTRGATAV